MFLDNNTTASLYNTRIGNVETPYEVNVVKYEIMRVVLKKPSNLWKETNVNSKIFPGQIGKQFSAILEATSSVKQ